MKTIFVAGGCFWGVQEWFRRVKGINSSKSYYLNGGFENVTYQQVCRASGHVEAVKLEYDESLISLKDIFLLMLEIVNPFSLNKQGNDVGVQYRIGFYFYEKDQTSKQVIKDLISEFEVKHDKTTFEVEDVKDETLAEEYHQDYLVKNPSGYCHINLNLLPDKYKK
ncbi:peptide-methionine (S)-S-oxide reductase MsrA [Mycoplasmopsis agassizii]|uniref:Peptide methionine sulfoxide reductase MsrA n=1 Tax=Mycoplasmopsis agassizii TaxID=33922 RepID=A0ABX4H5K9_9BACT|nr:peptide-methionine (S)-S-oxide reductase MsrA [Mycoplasmopsis agassizii]PAF55184.1 peptide-methionine (S)-S-oxide reductase [Mycoplasmopsis agassizii]SMC19842.1 peptide-methionine (S)-S-oxide reductase [Mycoplasmopsis agassizii]